MKTELFVIELFGFFFSTSNDNGKKAVNLIIYNKELFTYHVGTPVLILQH